MNSRNLYAIMLAAGVLLASNACSFPSKKSGADRLHFAPSLPGADEMIAKTLDLYYSLAKPYGPFRSEEMADRSKLEIQPPIARYKLEAESAIAGTGLEAAKLVSYRYYIKVSGEYVGIIESPFENGSFVIQDKKMARHL